MNAFNIMFALLAFLGFVAIMPGLMHFVGLNAAEMPDYTLVLVNLVPPALASMFLASWLQTGGN